MQVFCSQLEASCLQWSFLLTIDKFIFLLTIRAFSLTILAFLLTIGAFCLQWESASNKRLKGLQAKKLNCKQKAQTVSNKLPPKVTIGCAKALPEVQDDEICIF